MQLQTAFTETQRANVEALRADLVASLRRPVTTEYGQTDSDQFWAALCVEDRHGVPTALVSILIGAGVQGEAAVLARDGSPVREGITFSAALRSARSVGMRGVRRGTRAPKAAALSDGSGSRARRGAAIGAAAPAVSAQTVSHSAGSKVSSS